MHNAVYMLENKLFEDTGRRPSNQGDRTVVRALVMHANNLGSALCRPSGLPSTPHECILNMSTGWDSSQIKGNRKMPPLSQRQKPAGTRDLEPEDSEKVHVLSLLHLLTWS